MRARRFDDSSSRVNITFPIVSMCSYCVFLYVYPIPHGYSLNGLLQLLGCQQFEISFSCTILFGLSSQRTTYVPSFHATSVCQPVLGFPPHTNEARVFSVDKFKELDEDVNI